MSDNDDPDNGGERCGASCSSKEEGEEEEEEAQVGGKQDEKEEEEVDVVQQLFAQLLGQHAAYDFTAMDNLKYKWEPKREMLRDECKRRFDILVNDDNHNKCNNNDDAKVTRIPNSLAKRTEIIQWLKDHPIINPQETQSLLSRFHRHMPPEIRALVRSSDDDAGSNNNNNCPSSSSSSSSPTEEKLLLVKALGLPGCDYQLNDPFVHYKRLCSPNKELLWDECKRRMAMMMMMMQKGVPRYSFPNRQWTSTSLADWLRKNPIDNQAAADQKELIRRVKALKRKLSNDNDDDNNDNDDDHDDDDNDNGDEDGNDPLSLELKSDCEVYYTSVQPEAKKAVVLVSMAIGLSIVLPGNVPEFARKLSNLPRPNRLELLSEVCRRQEDNNDYNNDYNFDYEGASVEQIESWLRDNPIRDKACIDFVQTTLEATLAASSSSSSATDQLPPPCIQNGPPTSKLLLLDECQKRYGPTAWREVLIQWLMDNPVWEDNQEIERFLMQLHKKDQTAIKQDHYQHDQHQHDNSLDVATAPPPPPPLVATTATTTTTTTVPDSSAPEYNSTLLVESKTPYGDFADWASFPPSLWTTTPSSSKNLLPPESDTFDTTTTTTTTDSESMTSGSAGAAADKVTAASSPGVAAAEEKDALSFESDYPLSVQSGDATDNLPSSNRVSAQGTVRSNVDELSAGSDFPLSVRSGDLPDNLAGSNRVSAEGTVRTDATEPFVPMDDHQSHVASSHMDMSSITGQSQMSLESSRYSSMQSSSQGDNESGLSASSGSLIRLRGGGGASSTGVEMVLLDKKGQQGRYTGERSFRVFGRPLPDGKGTMVYDNNGHCYEGDWSKGTWHGDGRLEYAANDYYQGKFVDGCFSGHGKRHWPDGSEYRGMFVSGLQQGRCTYRDYRGEEHKGKWVSNRELDDGSLYDGLWRDGKQHGYGKCRYHNGDSYEGTCGGVLCVLCDL